MAEDAEALEQIARAEFGLEVAMRLPVTESFSSSVLSFVADDHRHYVLKQHWARNKAEREATALTALAEHPDVPSLLATSDRGGTLTLLIEGRDGVPWEHVGDAQPALLQRLGRSIGQVHRTAAASFDGQPTWHSLLVGNADRYVTMIGGDDGELATQAHTVLERHLGEVPDSDRPQLVHFDLRPGNVLVRDGQLVAIIDFEACRGGHPSMDFFKLWQQVAPRVTGGLTEVLGGYAETAAAAEPWMEPAALDRLMRIYAAYHGLAGLAWCHDRREVTSEFAAVNRGLIREASTLVSPRRAGGG
jgi:aminoglycoside phosphotransferase (APT) family kinase protein